jgi:hypothetical protein
MGCQLTDTIIAIFGHEAKKIGNKSSSVALGRSHLREDVSPWARVTECPTSKSNNDLEIRVASLDIADCFEDVRVNTIHICDLKSIIDIAKGDKKVSKHMDGDLSRAHSAARLIHVPRLPVTNNDVLGVGRRSIGTWGITIGLTAITTAEFICCATEAMFGAADVQRALLAWLLCVAAALCVCVAVGLAAVAAVVRAVAAPAILAAASSIVAWLVWPACVVVLTTAGSLDCCKTGVTIRTRAIAGIDILQDN